MNVLFRCDASLEIGMGHVIRCLALADELTQNHNCNVSFSMRRWRLGLRKVKTRFPVLEQDKDNASFNCEEWLIQCINKTRSDTLILDVKNDITVDELAGIRNSTGVTVVTIDDLEDKRLESDLSFYPPIPQVGIKDWGDYRGKYYVGWEYVILRKEFQKTYQKQNNRIPRICVVMGGSDANDMTRFVVETLKLVEIQFSVTIILGPGYRYRRDLQNDLDDSRMNYSIELDPDNIVEIMAQSDLGIISFGVTAYELAAQKVPAIYLCLSDDHVDSSQLFETEGIGISLGNYEKVTQQSLVVWVKQLLENRSILRKMSLQTESLDISNLGKISSLILEHRNTDLSCLL